MKFCAHCILSKVRLAFAVYEIGMLIDVSLRSMYEVQGTVCDSTRASAVNGSLAGPGGGFKILFRNS